MLRYCAAHFNCVEVNATFYAVLGRRGGCSTLEHLFEHVVKVAEFKPTFGRRKIFLVLSC
jgi:uncharacterized protein YecE (DUF72 family)